MKLRDNGDESEESGLDTDSGASILYARREVSCSQQLRRELCRGKRARISSVSVAQSMDWLALHLSVLVDLCIIEEDRKSYCFK